MRIDHVGIYARDSDSLSDWYCNTLGLTVVRKLEKTGRPPIYFLRGEAGLDIEILPTTEQGEGRELKDAGLSHVGIVVDDLDEAVSCLTSKGIYVHDIRYTSQGWGIAYFEDPEGNRLEILQR